MRCLPATSLLFFVAAALALRTDDRENVSVDVVVYGATPAGIAAALAARAVGGGRRVLLVEATARVGGMASPGGIGLRDCDHDDVRNNTSTQMQWGMRNARFYGVAKPVWQPDAWVGERSFREMLAEAGVEVWDASPVVEGPAGVRVVVEVGAPAPAPPTTPPVRRLAAIAVERGGSANGGGAAVWVEAAYVVDASYEGDLLVAAGVTFTYGRESSAKYNESLGGVTAGSVGQFKPPVSPYVAGRQNATLLRYVQDGPDPREHVGAADSNLMAYSYRVCLTRDPANMVPVVPPHGYRSADFELARRYLLAELAAGRAPSTPYGDLTYHGYPPSKSMKYDACCGTSAVGIDAVGLAVGYATASRAERRKIAAAHRYYVQGLMHFWRTDPAVPAETRREMAAYGLCKDEFPDNGHFPPQLYVREAARLVGDRVYTQADHRPAGQAGGCRHDSVAIGSWGLDIHEMQRVAVREGPDVVAYNEGLTAPGTGGVFFSELPYWLLLPKRDDATNLAAPNCPSISHVAFAAVREEPTLWQLGQAAGTAAAAALAAGGVALHDVDVRAVQDALLDQGTFVHWPPRRACP